MKKIELKDVLHMYVGSKAIFLKSGRIITVFAYDCKLGWHSGVGWYSPEIYNFKLLLRPLSSLTDDEKIELYNLFNNDKSITAATKVCYMSDCIELMAFTPAQTLYLLKLSIDLFGLLDSLQAEKLEL